MSLPCPMWPDLVRLNKLPARPTFALPRTSIMKMSCPCLPQFDCCMSWDLRGNRIMHPPMRSMWITWTQDFAFLNILHVQPAYLTFFDFIWIPIYHDIYIYVYIYICISYISLLKFLRNISWHVSEAAKLQLRWRCRQWASIAGGAIHELRLEAV